MIDLEPLDSSILLTVVDRVAHAIAAFDARKRLVIANRRYADLLALPPALRERGTPFAEIIRHNARMGLYGEVGEEEAVAYWTGRIEDQADSVEQIRRANGDVFRIEKIPLPGGGFVLTYVDVTEIVRQRDALEESEARFRAIVEDQSEYILRFTADEHRCTFVNEAYCQALDCPRDLILGANVFEFVAEERGVQLRAALATLSIESPLRSGETDFLDPSGARVFEHWTDRALFDEDGRIAGYQSVGRDITEQSITREALKRSELHFKNIAEAHPVPVLIVRVADQKILHAGPAAVPMLGPDIAAVERRNAAQYFATRAERRNFLKALRHSGSVDRFELSICAADDRIVRAEVTARLVDYQGHRAIAAGIVDVSERIQAEEEIARQSAALAQSEKMSALGSLLASVAHELNNPIAIILGQAELMSELARDDTSVKRAARIRGAAERCSRIVKTFLAMARQKPPSREAVDLTALARGAIDLTHYALRTSGVALEEALDGALPEIEADGDQLSQVIVNLLINAQQALADSPGDGQVAISTECCGEDRVRLTVADNGPGVPPELRDRIFEPFFTTKPEGAGTGIGLSVCTNIARSHGGALWVEDNVPQGARFVLELPRRAGENQDVRSLSEVSSNRSEGAVEALHLLVVDDEEDIGQTIFEMLATDGHTVTITATGGEALAALAEGAYDGIISDIRMPEMDGPTLHRRIAETLPEMTDKIGFITGDTLSAPIRRFLEETGCPFLEKPFEIAEIRDLVSAVCR